MFDDLFVVNDGLDEILLGSFFFGLIFVVLSLALGLADTGVDHGGAAHDAGPIHLADGHSVAHIPVLNVSTVLAFLMWFGGVAYLLRNAVGLAGGLSLIVGVCGGLFGGFIILRAMRFLRGKEVYLDSRNERLAGSIGRVTSPIRPGGTGEITYELNGVRQVSAARAIDGSAMPRGIDVIVIKRDKGVAYVEEWKSTTDGADWEDRFAHSPRAMPPEIETSKMTGAAG